MSTSFGGCGSGDAAFSFFRRFVPLSPPRCHRPLQILKAPCLSRPLTSKKEVVPPSPLPIAAATVVVVIDGGGAETLQRVLLAVLAWSGCRRLRRWTAAASARRTGRSLGVELDENAKCPEVRPP